jgi:uncharacterized protein YkwD
VQTRTLWCFEVPAISSTRWLLLFPTALLAVGLLGCGSADPADDGDDVAVESSDDALTVRSDEADFFDRLNAARRAHGLHALRMQPGLVKIARAWSLEMNEKNHLFHRSNITQRIEATVTHQWTSWGENVGVGATVASLHKAFMNSPEHRANILGNFNYVGIGTSIQPDGTLWVTVDFLRSPDSLPTVKP